MGAFENIEELKTIVSDCIDENERIWNKSYEPSDKEQIIYRLNFYYDHIKDLEEVAGDLIYFCKNFIEDNPKKYYAFYRNEVSHNLNKVLEGGNKDTLWFRSKELLLWYYDKVKIYEREETTGICLYHYENTGRGEFVTRRTFSNGQWWDDYSLIARDTYRVCLEYCKLRESFEYKLLSLLCHYKDSKNGNVNIDYARPMIVFAHTICLYTIMHNERKLVLKDAKHARLNLEKLQGSTLAPQAQAKKKTKQPREVFTERAKEYFVKAEVAGYLKKVGNKYEWLYRGGTVALVYFFIRIYEPKSPPFKQLQPLFGVEGLTSSRRNLEKTDWYKDEMKREAMTPEELASERRERKLKEPKEWFPELKSFFED